MGFRKLNYAVYACSCRVHVRYTYLLADDRSGFSTKDVIADSIL